ncbi:MAG: hypothetical protein IKO05_12395 [Selenomonadaceae bacterium]|nr:hypothetical protein [Selenomonadaceae bacterium]
MSDNVVLSKHFDSLASAIQRCLSAGYAPTAYIPAGHESVIDNVASTVDGGMWYEVEGDIPVLKMHYGDYDFVVNLTIPREITFLIDLHADLNNDSYYDSHGNTWSVQKGSASHIALDLVKPFNSTASDADLEVFYFSDGQYLTHEELITLGNKDFAISFWHRSAMNTDEAQTTFTHFYNLAGEEVISVFENLTRSGDTGMSAHGINFAGTTYTFPAVQASVGEIAVHVEFDYSCSTNELKLFYNGTLVSTINANLSATTTATQIVGKPESNTSYDFMLGEFQLYNGLTLHSTDFTPTYTPYSMS